MARLDTVEPLDLVAAKERWLTALDQAESWVSSRPPEEIGCLYYSLERDRFEAPAPDVPLEQQGLICHFGRMGGVLPRAADQRVEREE